jgi:hypothetical protein
MPALKNPKHELFAQELAKGKTLEEAHRAAGYTGNRSAASQLKQKLNISQRVDEILAAREEKHAQSTAKAIERASLTKQWVIERLVANVERSMQAESVKDDEGNATGEYHYQGNVANRALELLGKELGMFIDRKEVGEPGEFERIDDPDELRRRLLELAEAAGERAIAAQLAFGEEEAGPPGRTH